MKNIILSIVVFLAVTNLYSQDFDYLKKTDTIYIEFNGNINEKKYSIQTRIQPTNFDERAYHFTIGNKWILYFQHPKYKNWEKSEANIVSEVRKVNNSFLKEHKSNIIGINFLEKYDDKNIICELFTHLKVFYIIDFTENKKGNAMLYEVNCINYCPIGE
jgi:hypothetical protein